MLGLHGGRGADFFAPRSHEVECDHSFAGLSGQFCVCCGVVTMSFQFLLKNAPLTPQKTKGKRSTDLSALSLTRIS